MRFIDSNIFLRHLLKDHSEQSPACFALIRDIEQGREQVWTTDLVVSEIVFVLSSKKLYNLDRERIRELLLPLIELPGIKLPQKRLYRRVFELYTTQPIDYVDAFNAACLEHQPVTEGPQVMICGNPAMVADSTAALEAKGLTKNRRRHPGQITTEVYK